MLCRLARSIMLHHTRRAMSVSPAVSSQCYSAPLVFIMGTTGVGKSEAAIQLALSINAEIINGDALQVYRGVDIITNKVSLEERQLIPHHLIDIREPHEVYTVVDFVHDASNIVDKIHTCNKLPIIVGGTHYYMQYLLWGNDYPTPIEKSDSLNEKLYTGPIDSSNTKNCASGSTSTPQSIDHIDNTCQPIINNKTSLELWSLLKQVDPVMAERWHPHDERKIKRSLQIYYSTGIRHSDIIANSASRTSHEILVEKQTTMKSSPREPKYNALIFWLHAQTEVLDKRLDKRIETMIERGMFDEIWLLRDYFKNRIIASSANDSTNQHAIPTQSQLSYEHGLLQAIGYKEFLPYLEAVDNKETIDSDKLVEIKRACTISMQCATRRYVRKQLSWIQNKLCARIKQESSSEYPKVHMYVLDATDLSQWDTCVRHPMLAITRAFMQGHVLPDVSTVHNLASTLLSLRTVNNDNNTVWKKYTCELCSRTLNGHHEWHVHTLSKQHKRATSRKNKSLLLEQHQQYDNMDAGDKRSISDALSQESKQEVQKRIKTNVESELH